MYQNTGLNKVEQFMIDFEKLKTSFNAAEVDRLIVEWKAIYNEAAHSHDDLANDYATMVKYVIENFHSELRTVQPFSKCVISLLDHLKQVGKDHQQISGFMLGTYPGALESKESLFEAVKFAFGVLEEALNKRKQNNVPAALQRGSLDVVKAVDFLLNEMYEFECGRRDNFEEWKRSKGLIIEHGIFNSHKTSKMNDKNNDLHEASNDTAQREEVAQSTTASDEGKTNEEGSNSSDNTEQGTGSEEVNEASDPTEVVEENNSDEREEDVVTSGDVVEDDE